ncbi:MAG: spore coat protein CotJB [Candidatus Gastranaerophilales bacterium]|nr:spore coat protein CotJB [Candidatus Gastranaerophilales bacterium]
MSDQEKLLRDIGIVDFVLVELTEYLDTHPFDRNAMEYFNHYARIKNQMSKEFARKYYPLTTELAESEKEWRWGMAPLPWEGVCG